MRFAARRVLTALGFYHIAGRDRRTIGALVEAYWSADRHGRVIITFVLGFFIEGTKNELKNLALPVFDHAIAASDDTLRSNGEVGLLKMGAEVPPEVIVVRRKGVAAYRFPEWASEWWLGN